MGYTKPCSHSFLLTPTHFHSFLTHFHSFPAHSHPLPVMFSSLLLILNWLLPMCSFSHLFSVHIQILSPNPNHHLQLEPMFSPSVLHAYISFNINLFFLLFSVLFWKQHITLGLLTTTFAYFKEFFVHQKFSYNERNIWTCEVFFRNIL